MSENALVQIIGRAVPFTKENQKATAQTLVTKVVEGEADPIQVFSTVKALVECLTIFLKDKDVVRFDNRSLRKGTAKPGHSSTEPTSVWLKSESSTITAPAETLTGTTSWLRKQNSTQRSRPAKHSCAVSPAKPQSSTKIRAKSPRYSRRPKRHRPL